MNRIIALVGKLTPKQEQAWLRSLGKSLPTQRIVSFAKIDQSEYQLVDIAIVANPDPADIQKLPNLRLIYSLWAGVERLLAELPTIPCPIVRMSDPRLAATMAESVLAWTYYLVRDMHSYTLFQRHRRWQPLEYRSPTNTIVSVLGLGNLGLAAAARLKDAGFCVQGWSRTPKYVQGIDTAFANAGLQKVLSTSDILVCLLPLTPETRGLIDREALKHLPATASLINFARGPVIVTADLLEALDSGSLKHAVLDVFDEEPLPMNSPLWSHPQVTVLPHISAPTSVESASLIVAQNIERFLSTGQLLSLVDPAKGY